MNTIKHELCDIIWSFHFLFSILLMSLYMYQLITKSLPCSSFEHCSLSSNFNSCPSEFHSAHPCHMQTSELLVIQCSRQKLLLQVFKKTRSLSLSLCTLCSPDLSQIHRNPSAAVSKYWDLRCVPACLALEFSFLRWKQLASPSLLSIHALKH